MKKLLSTSVLLLLLCILLALGAAAEDPWDEEYYRIIDYTDELSDAEIESLDEECIDILAAYQVDLALAAVTDETLGDIDMETLGEYLYNDCSFGYGSSGDGFMAVYNADTEEMVILCFGRAAARVDGEFRDFIVSSAPGFREEHGLFGVLYAVVRYTADYLAGSAETEPFPAGERKDRPDWYPEDPEHFVKYHDAAAPRVVDTADIFSDAEEARMEARLAELRAELGRDIVIFTDVSSYGLSHDVYAADFYDFNGYGAGGEYEGVCLFVCMDPADRGFWTCCTGPETMGLYTYAAANLLDDRLYSYMADGDYGDGAADWIENIRDLYRTGIAFPPAWYSGPAERAHDAAAPRVTDELGELTAEELDRLTAEARAVSEKYGIDVAIHLGENRSSLSNREYSELYYRTMGYGLGENYDGILFSIVRGSGYAADTLITAFGAGADRLTGVNEYRMLDKYFARWLKTDEYEGLRGWLKDLAHMEKTGRVTRLWRYWGWMALLGAALGAVFGGISVAGAKRKMAVPAVKETAEAYLDRESLQIDKVLDQYLSSSTSREYSPVERSSGGGSGGGGGGSSYSGSYSGSSGTSHSGSGRSF